LQKYSELSKPQKRVIDLMKQGNELRYYFRERQFLFNGELGTNVKKETVQSLCNRHFIQEYFRNDSLVVYCCSIEIEGIPYKNTDKSLTEVFQDIQKSAMLSQDRKDRWHI
jgi:hypothetical protein